MSLSKDEKDVLAAMIARDEKTVNAHEAEFPTHRGVDTASGPDRTVLSVNIPSITTSFNIPLPRYHTDAMLEDAMITALQTHKIPLGLTRTILGDLGLNPVAALGRYLDRCAADYAALSIGDKVKADMTMIGANGMHVLEAIEAKRALLAKSKN